MGLLKLFEGNKELVIPKYQARVKNSVYTSSDLYPLKGLIDEDQSSEGYLTTIITRYSLPTGNTIINYLQTKAEEVNKFRGETFHSPSENFGKSSLDLLLQSDINLAKKLEGMNSEIQDRLREHFPSEVEVNYKEANLNDNSYDYDANKHFISLKNGFIYKKRIDEICTLKGNMNPLVWANNFSTERWTLDVFYEHEFPRVSQIRAALEMETKDSRIIKTTNVKKRKNEMETVVKPLYRFTHKNKKFWSWKDCSKQKLEEFSYQTIVNFCYGNHMKKLEQSQQLFTLTIFGNTYNGDILN